MWRYDVAVGWRCDLITDCHTKTVLLVYVFEQDSSAAELADVPTFFHFSRILVVNFLS